MRVFSHDGHEQQVPEAGIPTGSRVSVTGEESVRHEEDRILSAERREWRRYSKEDDVLATQMAFDQSLLTLAVSGIGAVFVFRNVFYPFGSTSEWAMLGSWILFGVAMLSTLLSLLSNLSLMHRALDARCGAAQGTDGVCRWLVRHSTKFSFGTFFAAVLLAVYFFSENYPLPEAPQENFIRASDVPHK